MSRPRQPDDWHRDLAAARPGEQRVAAALAAHPEVSHFSDFSTEMDDLDFEFTFEAARVRVDVKEKRSRTSAEVAEQWPEVQPDDLFILDETSFRTLVWAEGLGYLLIHDQPRSRWHVFGPWELCLGPRRRFERRSTKTTNEFLKGKLLLDLRTAAVTTPELDVSALLRVVRGTRTALRQVQAIRLPSQGEIPIIPKYHQRRESERTAPAPAPTPADIEDVELDPAWAGLSNELVVALTTKWKWSSPTAVQLAAFPAILARRNTLVLGPTAGGKTEAALLPLLDLWRQFGWAGRRPSILVISPMRALIDDQLARWREAGALVGATSFAWHGDISQDDRRAFKDKPTDALLTTPESLELLLTSPSHDERALLAGLRAVVVDEVHAFVGTPRGAQVASLLERLQRFTEDDLQRIGLTATVANPGDVLDWLRGGSHRDHEVVGATAAMQGEQLSLRSYDDLPGSVSVIGSELDGHRSLVFVRSRRRAEELAHELGIAVHHGSLSGERRVEALSDLAAGVTYAVVATSTLEMGIDVGDLDLVVHDGAPSSPSSYLQRLGRSGRKSGHRRMVFTTGEPDELLLTLGVLARVRRGDLGALSPQRGTRLVLGQQALALVMQSFVTNRGELYETLRWSPAFHGLEQEIEATLDHLLAGRWLHADGDRLVLGAEGNRRFGGTKGVASLLATFKAAELATVVDEAGRHVGNVDWSALTSPAGSDDQRALVLGGSSWTVVRIDRAAGVAVVRSGGRGRPPSWKGPVLEVERPTWKAVREVLEGTDVPLLMDDQAQAWLEAARARWRPLLDSPVQAADGTTMVHSFAGVEVHRAVLAMLGIDGSAEGTTCVLEASRDAVRAGARRCLADLEVALTNEAARVAPQLLLAHGELTAPSVLEAEARAFHVDDRGITGVLELLAVD